MLLIIVGRALKWAQFSDKKQLMIHINVREFNSEKEGLNTLPKPKFGDKLIVFYSNIIASFHKIITVDMSGCPEKGTLRQSEDAMKWNESDFLHFEGGSTESERVPFRSFIHINSCVENACIDREKLKSSTTYLLNL